MNNPKEINVGLDISTSVVGVCALDCATNNLVKLFAIKLTSSKFKDEYDKAEEVRRILKEELGSYSIKNIFIEEAHMRFTPGFSSAKTLFTLATFNGIVSQIAYTSFGVKPQKINVRTARKNLGIKINTKDKSKSNKEKVFDAVVERNPDFPWYKRIPTAGKNKGVEIYDQTCFDMADAWVIVAGAR